MTSIKHLNKMLDFQKYGALLSSAKINSSGRYWHFSEKRISSQLSVMYFSSLNVGIHT